MQAFVLYAPSTVAAQFRRWASKNEKIWYNIIMKLRRDLTRLKTLTKKDDSFVNASPKELIAFMWELTAELWSLRKAPYVERRLQRKVTNLIKQ
jgi:hypothetical protein